LVKQLHGPAAAGLALLALLLAACAGPAPGAAGGGRTLFVANGEEATLSRLDSASGRVTGPPLPTGRAPWQIATGANGSLLVLSISPRHSAELTYIARQSGGYASRSINLEPKAREGQMASDGRYAVVAYHLPGPATPSAQPRCRMAVVDLEAGALLATYQACDAFESVFTLAVEPGPAGPSAYLGIWRWPHVREGGVWAPGAGRLVVLNALSGAVQDVLPLDGAPSAASVAAGPHGEARRLYLVETRPGPESEYTSPERWSLLTLDPVTLEERSRRLLSEPPLWLTVAPDGADAYYAIGGSNLLMHVDLTTGVVRQLAALPGMGLGMAVTHDRLFVPNPTSNEVWVVDRRSGRRLRPFLAGRHPIGLALGS
jgi:hypothetical protein